METLRPLSRVTTQQMDSVRRERRKKNDRTRGMLILMEAQRYWDNLAEFRENRDRCKRYCYGDQWGDRIKGDGCGCSTVTEEQYIRNQGSVPLKNNIIRRLVRNIIGVYRSQSKEPTCIARDRDEQTLGETMSTLLQYNWQANKMEEVNARSLEELLISAVVVHRKSYGWRNDRLDCWTDYVQPDNFFVDNNMRDFRGWDATCVGEIHDVSFNAVCSQFAKNSKDYAALYDIYRDAQSRENIGSAYGQFLPRNNKNNYDFLVPTAGNVCRVIEVWRKEQKPRYRCHDYNTGEIFKCEIEDYDDLVGNVNADRLRRCREAGIPDEEAPLIKADWFMDDYWYYYFLSPFGDILDEGETPFQHKSHPYSFLVYPGIDGEAHSYVGDVIDQQRYINRLVTMHDWIMRASAKGVLIFPQEALPDGMSLEDVADEWSRFNGVIAIKAKPGVPMPQQISQNATNVGITELLNIELKLIEDISGVNGALQGKPGFSGMAASLYAQQTQNATTSLLDILASFSSFIIDSAYKDIKNMQQYYDQKRVINIAGRRSSKIVFDPEKVKDVEFDISVQESTTTPVYRAMANEFIMQLLQMGLITVDQALEVGTFPFSDELLQSIKVKQEEQAQQMAEQQAAQEKEQAALQEPMPA